MKLIDYAALSILVMLPMVVSAQQPQQPPPKNYAALIAQQGRALCEESLATFLLQNDELRQQVLKLQDELKAVRKEKHGE